MTDRPKTMVLSPYEWRVLIATGFNNAYSYIGALTANAAPEPVHVHWLHDTLDRLRVQVSAWAASGQPQPAASPPEPAEHVIGSNGMAMFDDPNADSPKKKRGWQKGRKRGPRKPKPDEAVQ